MTDTQALSLCSLLLLSTCCRKECLLKAAELSVPGADIATICGTVDAMIEEEVKKTFASKKSKNLERGIAFPTCISVNHIMGHYSPLIDESTQLQEGDVAKM